MALAGKTWPQWVSRQEKKRGFEVPAGRLEGIRADPPVDGGYPVPLRRSFRLVTFRRSGPRPVCLLLSTDIHSVAGVRENNWHISMGGLSGYKAQISSRGTRGVLSRSMTHPLQATGHSTRSRIFYVRGLKAPNPSGTHQHQLNKGRGLLRPQERRSGVTRRYECKNVRVGLTLFLAKQECSFACDEQIRREGRRWKGRMQPIHAGQLRPYLWTTPWRGDKKWRRRKAISWLGGSNLVA